MPLNDIEFKAMPRFVLQILKAGLIDKYNLRYKGEVQDESNLAGPSVYANKDATIVFMLFDSPTESSYALIENDPDAVSVIDEYKGRYGDTLANLTSATRVNFQKDTTGENWGTMVPVPDFEASIFRENNIQYANTDAENFESMFGISNVDVYAYDQTEVFSISPETPIALKIKAFMLTRSSMETLPNGLTWKVLFNDSVEVLLGSALPVSNIWQLLTADISSLTKASFRVENTTSTDYDSLFIDLTLRNVRFRFGN